MSFTVAIVAPSSVPFQVGGAEKLWWGMRNALGAEPGVFAELVKLPAPEENFADIIKSYKKFSELDLSHFDMVISTKYPAWMISHSNHILYMQHVLRGLYDTYHFTGLPETLHEIPAPLKELVLLARKEEPDRNDLQTMFEMCRNVQNIKSLPSSLFAFPGPLIREIVHFFDRVALNKREISRYFAISRTVSERDEYFPAGADVTVLHHPSDISGFYNEPGKYIFTASRINHTKRVRLLVEAMNHVSAHISLKIAGTGPELEELKMRAAGDARINFLGYVPDSELTHYYANALCVPFVPYEEDYGLITIEAMASGKPVITATDSGGVREFVENGVTGFCVEPTAREIGAAIQKLAERPELAAQMGNAARRKVADISWKNVATSLVHAAGGNKELSASHSGRIVVLCPFSANAHGFGGQRRVYHLCASLAKKFNVCLVCYGTQAQFDTEERQVAPGFLEIRLPLSDEIVNMVEILRRDAQCSVDDVAMMRACASDSRLLNVLKSLLPEAACVIASHPYLYPAVRRLNLNIPLVYDAHNVEVDMKAVVMGNQNSSLLEEIAEVEKICCKSAAIIFACSQHDIKRFEELYGVSENSLSLAPNGYDGSAIRFMDREGRAALRKRLAYPDAKLALFIGSFHKPNLEAAIHIMHMAKKLPEVQFLLAGGVCNMPEITSGGLPGNVHLLGEVGENIKNMLLQAADIGLNPVTSGGGANLKIIEYLGAGLESISTPFGMRGLQENFGPAAHVCELAEFPDTIRKILQEPASTENLKEARRVIVKNYDWQKAMQPVQEKIGALAVSYICA